MIKRIQGDIFVSDCQAIVNPVNCVGVCGSGLAEEFKRRYPANFIEYREACLLKKLLPGNMLVVKTDGVFNPLYVINFPTKLHWRQPSKMEYIDEGLKNMLWMATELKIKSIAIPALGCGCGGLDWGEVWSLLESHLKVEEDIYFEVYEPTTR